MTVDEALELTEIVCTVGERIQAGQVLAAEVRRLRAAGWIQVAGRLPDVDVPVLVAVSCRETRVPQRCEIDFLDHPGVWNAGMYRHSHSLVTHWRELPALPEATS